LKEKFSGEREVLQVTAMIHKRLDAAEYPLACAVTDVAG
jgi:hypothetical protein